MFVALLFHGILLVGFLACYGRWLDEEIVADVCLWALLVELVLTSGLVVYLKTTDLVFFLPLGACSSGWSIIGVSGAFCFDEVSALFLAILTFALILCFFFLTEYFEYDSGASTITLLSALFSQVALLYFSAYDLCLIFFFWEVISFISFLLVQHWAMRVTSYKAGLKVFVVSQFGDMPFFLFLFCLLGRVGTADIGEILALLPLLAFEFVPISLGSNVLMLHLVTLLGFLLQTAIFLKAAQWFFYPWLLDAMEAPVPISAQLHSSTLVVIGFFLFFRFQALFDLAPSVQLAFVLIGFVTSIGASVLGFFQEDGKKLLACSTAGQLGYVLVALGLGLTGEALALLTFCCCNKAFTFVWFGALMRRFSGMSDFRLLSARGLTWLEHAGLVVAIANFTVFPGAFCWHVKGLFNQGVILAPFASCFSELGLGLLQLTWFLSSSYLWVLYVSLFIGPMLYHMGLTTRKGSRELFRDNLSWHISRGRGFFWSQGAAYSFFFLSLLSVAVFALVWYIGLGALLHSDGGWVASLVSSAPTLAYY